VELNELLELLQARGVKRAVFDGDSLQEVEFFPAFTTPKGDTSTVEVELPADDGVPMGVKNAADLLMAKKPKGAS
jgi:hypothetical protein